MKLALVIILALVSPICLAATAEDSAAAAQFAKHVDQLTRAADRGADGSETKWKDVKFDVQRTNSLVTPIVGICEATPVTLKDGKWIGHKRRLRATLAYRDGRWAMMRLAATWLELPDGASSELDKESDSWIAMAKNMGLVP